MNEQTFRKELEEELLKHSQSALSSIASVIEALPEKAQELDFEVFPAQDGDGFFSVRANLDGPELYVLNKSIDEVADIFNPKYINGELIPYIPTLDPFDVEYEVNDLVVDCAANWILKLWNEIDSDKVNIPTYIIGHDEYGTVTPLKLK